ncbi:MAG: TIR domain-containing protein [Chloroflexota bacterium]
MTDVFISYSRQNSDFARQLTDGLRQSGKESWVDWEGIPLSSPNWWHEIQIGIEQADNFVFIMSPDSMASVVCNLELDYALDLKKRVVIVVHEDVQQSDAFGSIAEYMPDDAMQQRLGNTDPLVLARENWQRISHINWLFFREEDNFTTAFKKLVETVETDLDYVKAHTRYLARAHEWLRKDKRVDLLLFGEEIALAETWLAKAANYTQLANQQMNSVNPFPDEKHREFIMASREAETGRQRILRNLRLTGFVAGIASLIAIGIAIFAGISANDAIARLSTAEANQNIIATESQVQQNLADSLSLASDALEIANSGAPWLGLALAYEASLLSTPSFTQQTLFDIANIADPSRITQLKGHDNILGLGYSNDRTRLASISQTELVMWDTANNSILWRAPVSLPDRPMSIHFSDDDSQLIVQYPLYSFALYDATDGTPIALPENLSALGNLIALSPTSQTSVYVAGVEETIIVANEAFDASYFPLDPTEFRIVNTIAFSPDEEYVLIGGGVIIRNNTSSDNTPFIIVWDATTGTFTEYTGNETQHIDAITSISWQADGQQFVTGSADQTINLWGINDSGEIELVQDFALGAHAESVLSTAISDDGQTIVSASEDDTIIVWNVMTGTPQTVLRGHRDDVMSVFFSDDGQTVISGSRDGTIRFWRSETFTETQTWVSNNNTYIPDCTLRDVYPITNCVASDGTVTTAFAPNTSQPSLSDLNPQAIEQGSISTSQQRTVILESNQLHSWQLSGEQFDIIAIRVRSTSEETDLYFELYNPDGNLLIFNDDGALDSSDVDAQIINYMLPSTGTYTIVVGENSNNEAGYWIAMPTQQ